MFTPAADFPPFPAADIAALRDAAVQLRQLASTLDDATAMVRAVGASVYGQVWQGSAADAWIGQASAVCGDLHRGGPLLLDAARAADSLADEVADARAAYARARQDYDAAVTNRDAAATAVAAGAVHAAVAVTAGGQAMSDAAAAGGRAGEAAAAAGDAAARVFMACAAIASSVGHFSSAGPSSTYLASVWSQPGYGGVNPNWAILLLGSVRDNALSGAAFERQALQLFNMLKNTTRVFGDNGCSTIPDGMITESPTDPVHVLEVKNVAYQALTSQLRAQLEVIGRAAAGSTFLLVVNPTTKLSEPLQDALEGLSKPATAYELLPEGLLRRKSDGKVFRVDEKAHELVEHQPEDTDNCAPGVQAEPERVPMPGTAQAPQPAVVAPPDLTQLPGPSVPDFSDLFGELAIP